MIIRLIIKMNPLNSIFDYLFRPAGDAADNTRKVNVKKLEPMFLIFRPVFG